MNLRQLKYFISVVNAGNMTRAAEQLHIAQTALGIQIRQLEEDLRTPLLVRHSRGVDPTKAGSLLHSRALALLKHVEDIRNEVATCDHEESELIRLGITPALMSIIGSEIILTVQKQLPHVILRTVEGMSHVLFDTLSRGEVDYILCYDVPDQPQFSRTALLQDDLVLVTLPGPSKGEPIAFVEVLEETLALPGPGDTIGAILERTARDLGLEFKIGFEVGSVSAQKDLVRRGVATSVLPYHAVVEDVRAGKLDARRITMPSIRRTLFLASSKHQRPFRNDVGLTGAVRSSLSIYLDAVGPLAHPLWARTS